MRVNALMLATRIPEWLWIPAFAGDDRSQATYSAKVASQALPRSPSRRALRIDVERIERVARGHEQPVALDAAEAEIGGPLGQGDEADGLAGRVENLHSVQLRAAHAPAAPQIAVDVAAEAVGRAIRFGGDEGAAVRELVVVDVIDADHARRHAGLDDVELLLVGREGEPV